MSYQEERYPEERYQKGRYQEERFHEERYEEHNEWVGGGEERYQCLISDIPLVGN